MFAGQRRWGRDPTVVTLSSSATFNAPLSVRWRARAAQITGNERRRMRVFTCSWSDFFHEQADGWRDAAWDVIRRCPQYDWQILTKRHERIARCVPADWGDGWRHVWLGVSIENRRFVHRADILRQIPAAVRFISAEPLLGPLINVAEMWDESSGTDDWGDSYVGADLDLTGIDWLICGGESGPRHRPMRLEWARELRDACRRDGTAFFMKQLSGLRPGRLDGCPPDLLIQEFPRCPWSAGPRRGRARDWLARGELQSTRDAGRADAKQRDVNEEEV
jgi:protein gp37